MNPYAFRVGYSDPETLNPIHLDATAARYGFAGALVPGVYMYAWMTVPIVARWGMDWVERGRTHAKFVAPFYDGDDAIFTASPHEDGSLTLIGDCRAGGEGEDRGEGENSSELEHSGRRCAVGSAILLDERPHFVVDDYPTAPLPTHRPLASREAFGQVLGTVESTYTEASTGAYRRLVHEPLPLYEIEGVVHPADIARLGNEVLMANVKLGPWIHTETVATHLGRVAVGETVQARTRVKRLFERKGHELIELDILCVAIGGASNSAVALRPVMHLAHTAIYRLAEPIAS